MSRLFFLIVLAAVSITALGLDDKKCSTMINKATFKTYKYQGIGMGAWGPITAATKKEGSTRATSDMSTESSTATWDPGLTTNRWASSTQSSSSFGPCSAFALNELKNNRNQYFVQNRDRVLHEIAVGRGEHLRVIAALSLCEENYFDLLAEKFQSNMSSFLENQDGNYNPIVDGIVRSDKELSKGCFSFEGV